MSNLTSTLKRRKRAVDPMREYDRLPPALRLWLSQAALPWSAASARRMWCKALKEAGQCETRAMEYMTRVEANSLAKDAPRIWGASYVDINRAAAR